MLWRILCFNPHRPRKAGATSCSRSAPLPILPVSILTGLERPVQLWCSGTTRRSFPSFNPHRPRKAGATRRRHCQVRPGRSGFNPHRPRKAGATPFRSTRYPLPGCFNPHRPRKAGATQAAVDRRPAGQGFNPHRPRKAGATIGAGVTWLETVLVSILTGLERPVQLSGGCWPSRPSRFQSSPASKGRCNARFVKGSGKKS